MRLRIQTLPPLPELKAWFVPDPQKTLNSIKELKRALCASLGVLKEACVASDDIQLFLDDFELLNESPFAVALRDGDLICIKASQTLNVQSTPKTRNGDSGFLPYGKRKRTHKSARADEKHRQVKIRKVSESSESEKMNDTSASSSSSSSSSGTSSSPSSTSSETEESVSDSESSSSSSAPSLHPSKSAAQRSQPQVVHPSHHSAPPLPAVPFDGPFVPPGQGKPTTHARNLRRKRLRAAQKEERASSTLQPAQTAPLPPNSVSQTNAHPLGERRTSVSERPAISEVANGKDGLRSAEAKSEEKRDVMMASFGNKNKKKGFKQFLNAPVPNKIVFSEDQETFVSSQIFSSHSTPVSRSTTQTPMSRPTALGSGQGIKPSASLETQKPFPRLIPPSEVQERGELPPNMFVTSVDVEADLWDKTRKTKSKNRHEETKSQYGSQHLNDASYYRTDDDLTLSYGDEESTGFAKEGVDWAEGSSRASQFNWTKAEQSFDNAPKVVHPDDIKQDLIVGWKSLDLNPQTFTPEILLIAAKVIASSVSASTIKVQRLVRPTNPDSALAGFLTPMDPDASAEGAEAEVEEYQWADIVASDWRVLQIS